MNTRILKDGSGVDSFDKPVDLIIHTKAPGKWKLTDLETGEEYLGSEISTDFAEVLREKVKVEMAKTDMDSVEKYADSQMSPTDVDLGKETDHFFQRLNDPRNGKEISPAELTGLFKRLARNKKKFLEFLKQYKEFVVKDRVSNINIAFIKVADRLIAKTVMRKADFKSSTPVFTTESVNEAPYNHNNINVKDHPTIVPKKYIAKLPKGNLDGYIVRNGNNFMVAIIDRKNKLQISGGTTNSIKNAVLFLKKNGFDLQPLKDAGIMKPKTESLNESLIMEGGSY